MAHVDLENPKPKVLVVSEQKNGSLSIDAERSKARALGRPSPFCVTDTVRKSEPIFETD
jgi:hypothetical protein